MKTKIISLFLLLLVNFTWAQNNKVQIYNPQIDAEKELSEAIQQAKKENKHILIQIGGNWCPWCIKLHGYFKEEPKVDSLLKADFIFVKINYSKENKNLPLMKKLDYPQRFGFPVLVILDASGKRLHTQDSGMLESGKGYDKEKVFRFLKCWNPKALNPEFYLK